MDSFVLCYELKNGKMLKLEFNLSVDIEAYNKTILTMYGKKIKRRYVIDKNDNVMSLKQFKSKFVDNT